MSTGFQFRAGFGRVSRPLNWYPKHMNSGMKQMQAKLRSVDCILELHDARIPISGRNPRFFDAFVRDKPHILILNKVDLIPREAARNLATLLAPITPNLVFTNAKFDQDPGVKKITPLMKKLIEESDRYHRSDTQEFHAMIIGVPNVGKSSLINILRAKNLKKGRSLKVGPSAGVTKCVHEKVRISQDPPIFLFDTPGILTPRIDGDDAGMKLAVCANLPDHDVGEMLIADYILYTLNRKKAWNRYIPWLGLDGPTDCITTALTRGCLHLQIMNVVKDMNAAVGTVNKPNFDLMAKMFIEKFRSGEFGKWILDEMSDVEEWVERKGGGTRQQTLSHSHDSQNETWVTSSSS